MYRVISECMHLQEEDFPVARHSGWCAVIWVSWHLSVRCPGTEGNWVVATGRDQTSQPIQDRWAIGVL